MCMEQEGLNRAALQRIVRERDDYAARLRDVADAVESMDLYPGHGQLLDLLDELRALMEVAL